MAEARIITFDYKEIATALIKQANIREGKWQILVEFGISGSNIPWPPIRPEMMASMPNPNLVPAAIIPMVKMGLQKMDQDSPMSVDASIVNPPPER